MRFLLTFAGAVALHSLWDEIGILVAYAVLAVLSSGLLTLTARVAARDTRPDRSPGVPPEDRQRPRISA